MKYKCESCNSEVNLNDSFCTSCGSQFLYDSEARSDYNKLLGKAQTELKREVKKLGLKWVNIGGESLSSSNALNFFQLSIEPADEKKVNSIKKLLLKYGKVRIIKASKRFPVIHLVVDTPQFAKALVEEQKVGPKGDDKELIKKSRGFLGQAKKKFGKKLVLQRPSEFGGNWSYPLELYADTESELETADEEMQKLIKRWNKKGIDIAAVDPVKYGPGTQYVIQLK